MNTQIIVKQNPEKFGLRSILDEALACRKAFACVGVGTWVMHCHHEVLFEKLTEPAENRIAYILSEKPEHEQALRLRLFRPISKTVGKKLDPLYADYRAKLATLHAKNCIAGCPWNGKTIFPTK